MVLRHQPRHPACVHRRLPSQPLVRAPSRGRHAPDRSPGPAVPRAPDRRPGAERRRSDPPHPRHRVDVHHDPHRRRHHPDDLPRARRRRPGRAAPAPLHPPAAPAGPRDLLRRRRAGPRGVLRGSLRRRRVQRLPPAVRRHSPTPDAGRRSSSGRSSGWPHNRPGLFGPFRVREWVSSPYGYYDDCLRWPAPHHWVHPVPPHATYPDVPTLVLVGDQDSLTSPEGARDTAIAFPDATFVETANMVHVSPWWTSTRAPL